MSSSVIPQYVSVSFHTGFSVLRTVLVFNLFACASKQRREGNKKLFLRTANSKQPQQENNLLLDGWSFYFSADVLACTCTFVIQLSITDRNEYALKSSGQHVIEGLFFQLNKDTGIKLCSDDKFRPCRLPEAGAA